MGNSQKKILAVHTRSIEWFLERLIHTIAGNPVPEAETAFELSSQIFLIPDIQFWSQFNDEGNNQSIRHPVFANE